MTRPRTASPIRRRPAARVALVAGLATVATLGFAGPASAATNLVSDGDFATPSAGATYVTYCTAVTTNCATPNPTLGPWTVTKGSVDLYGSTFSTLPTGDPATTQLVDLDGSEPGGISQGLSLSPGGYTVSFQVGPNIPGCADTVPKTFTYGIGANPAGTFTYDPTTTTGWTPVSFPVSVATTGGYPVFFTSNDAADSVCGAVITDVSVTAIPDAGAPMVDPAIAAGGLGGLGVIALAVLALRRRRSDADA